MVQGEHVTHCDSYGVEWTRHEPTFDGTGATTVVHGIDHNWVDWMVAHYPGREELGYPMVVIQHGDLVVTEEYESEDDAHNRLVEVIVKTQASGNRNQFHVEWECPWVSCPSCDGGLISDDDWFCQRCQGGHMVPHTDFLEHDGSTLTLSSEQEIVALLALVGKTGLVDRLRRIRALAASGLVDRRYRLTVAGRLVLTGAGRCCKCGSDQVSIQVCECSLGGDDVPDRSEAGCGVCSELFCQLSNCPIQALCCDCFSNL